MKKKIFIINVLLSMAVLFSILFQSVHSCNHFSEKFKENFSHFHLSKNKADITDHHSFFEKCTVCDFNFSSFTTINFLVFTFYKNNVVKAVVFFLSTPFFSFFKGSLYSLRGPPVF